ncbi:hypothetical protein NDU88_008009 [Pleurodeles waltl]|uniref:Uncharacterized protein n=1 Tax=Pleurodeles waltl TaxID=8319 RepID=A0AAV7NZ11_PLEWA|nr:hypothetical protein NDU88_008009 [Pleurodeles waltl]
MILWEPLQWAKQPKRVTTSPCSEGPKGPLCTYPGGTLEWAGAWNANPDIRLGIIQKETRTVKVARSERIGTEMEGEGEEDERANRVVSESPEPAAERSNDESKPGPACRDAEAIEDPAPLTGNAETPSHIPGGTWLLPKKENTVGERKESRDMDTKNKTKQ